MSDEGKKEKEIKIKFKTHSNLNSYHDYIFSQIDRRMMEQGRLNVMQTLGTNSIQQMISDYQEIISGNSLSNLLTEISQTVPNVFRTIHQDISRYNALVNQNLLNAVDTVKNLSIKIPIPDYSHLTLISDQIKSLTSQLSNISTNALNQSLQAQRTLLEHGVLSSLSESIHNLTKSVDVNLISSISEMLESNKVNLSNAFNQSYSFEGNTLIIESEKYNFDELRMVIDDIVNESDVLSLKKDIKNSIKDINTSISNIKSSGLRYFILSLIFAFILQFVFTVFGKEITDYSKSIFKQKSRIAIKKITEASQQLSIETKDVLRNYRYVSKDILIVRLNPKQKSQKIGELFFGQVVQLKKYKKDWSFVEVTDENLTEHFEGWVLSRYLRKFK